MLNLSKGQMERRVALLKELYEEGYRYIAATDTGSALAGKTIVRKAITFGVWSMGDATTIRPTGFSEDLFPDVKWEDEKPMVIEEELEKLKQVN